MKFDLAQLKTIVIKIGTNLLSGQQAFEGQVMEAVVKEVCALKRGHGLNVLLVTSGAVGCGMRTLGMDERPSALPQKQAVAAVGQAALMHAYQVLFQTHGQGLHSAQVLLTAADLDSRQSYLNVRNTLHALFSMRNIVPIINENDSTAVEELRFGDNDTLAAKIAAKIGASLLIILTDVDGLYDRNPAEFEDAALIEEIAEITPEIEALAGGAGSTAATGGMRTKLDAAKIAAAAGLPSVIANGHRTGVIQGVLEGSVPCTVFAAAQESLSHRKRWIAFGRAPQGAVIVDEGAHRALTRQGKSLLAAGIVEVQGEFDAGDAVEVRDLAGRTIARALVNYSAREIERIKGRKSHEIEGLLGRKDFDEVAHRDNMAML